MAMFLVLERHAGPLWDHTRPMEEQSDWRPHAAFMDGLVASGFIILGGPLADGDRVMLAVEADSEEAIRRTLAPDPWMDSHLVIDSIEAWTIRLDARHA